ncbi:pilus (MSHA type) biogenesis protein MshL [Methylobacillus caricis]|uniref:pilus (MSHA type) biogenesis protein MshL n=1 Tax=Methylobacillus caricis TaxID=1971611 RepID=UPI001CFFEFE1|nr:pilus (MSHA type) biogenesis protein MshL [Methylobacillus caricis]MCB5188202.1 pilus (MSHA type) biogenesis protein MshL [Methylobacillus caricis]
MPGQLQKIASILILPFLGLASCAHQSTVSPSTGHISESPPPAVGPASIPKPVKSASYLPPPIARSKEQTYSVVVNDVPVKEILFALARESKLNIDIHPAIQGRVTLNAVDQTLQAILERLAKQVDLTYRVDGSVLSITPDMPVLRSYKVDYVNMSRDTTGFIGAAAEIASTGRSASTTGGGASGGSTSSGSSSSGTGAANSSRTAVNSESKNHLWETLIQNLKDILAETDKEVIITRAGNTAQSPDVAQMVGAEGAETPTSVRSGVEEREQARTEYKTLFAATVIASPETGIVSVRATNRQHEKVQEFLDKVMTSARRQVLIEASIVEVTLNDTYQAGIDWSRIGNGFNMNESLGLASVLAPAGIAGTAGTRAPFSIGYSSSDINLSLRLLQQFGNTKVLSSPKLMVLNNQTAVLKVVDNLVYFTIQSQISQGSALGANNLQSITTTPNTVPVGVVMSVTPQINETGLVNINVRPTISRVLSYVDDPNPQLAAVTPPIVSRIPQIQVRELESVLRVSSGDTAVLGGLMQDNIQQATDNVPGISKVPLLGKLFTARSNFNVKTELVIFLRPVVIQNASLESDELSSYKEYLPAQQLQKLINESVN